MQRDEQRRLSHGARAAKLFWQWILKPMCCKRTSCVLRAAATMCIEVSQAPLLVQLRTRLDLELAIPSRRLRHRDHENEARE